MFFPSVNKWLVGCLTNMFQFGWFNHQAQTLSVGPGEVEHLQATVRFERFNDVRPAAPGARSPGFPKQSVQVLRGWQDQQLHRGATWAPSPWLDACLDVATEPFCELRRYNSIPIHLYTSVSNAAGKSMNLDHFGSHFLRFHVCFSRRTCSLSHLAPRPMICCPTVEATGYCPELPSVVTPSGITTHQAHPSTAQVVQLLRKRGVDLDHNRFLILQGAEISCSLWLCP